MRKRSSDLKMVGYFGVIFSSVALFNALTLMTSAIQPLSLVDALWVQKFYSILLLLFLLQLIGFVALLELDEWGRRLLVGVNFVSCIYLSYSVIMSLSGIPGIEILALLNIALLFYLTRSRIRNQCQKTKIVKRPTILLVDDDVCLLKTLEYTLGSEGFNILMAPTGEDGLRIARTHKPSLIVLDVILPKLKGREVCVKLKEDNETMDIPVLFLTAKDSEDDIKAEIAAGGVGHLTKPISSKILMDEIRRILNIIDT